MSQIRNRIEESFERLGYFLYQNPFKALLTVFVCIGVLSLQIPKITVDTSIEGALHKNDPYRLDYDAFRNQFGQDEMIMIGIKSPEIFNADFLSKLKSFHEDLENEVPHIQEVNSLINARNTRGEGDELIVGELLEDWPEQDIDMVFLRKLVTSSPLYLNNFISEDGGLTTIIVETDALVVETDDKNILDRIELEGTSFIDEGEHAVQRYLSEKDINEIISALHNVTSRYQSSDFSISLAGTPIMFNALKKSMMSDMRIFLKLSVIMIALFLLLLFRRTSGVILPLIVVISSVLSIIGLMALFNVPFTRPTQIIPSFLMAVGVGDAVHILSIFYQHLCKGDSKKDAIAFAMKHSGLAIVMTSLTTAAGLLSFSFADVAPIANMGIFSAVGVMLALLYTIIMIPAFIAVIPIKYKQDIKKQDKGLSFMDRILLAFADFAVLHPVKILTASIIVIAISIISLLQIKFSHNPIGWLPDTMTIKKDVALLDKELKGTTTLEVIIDTKEENGLYEPEILNHIEELSRAIEKIKTNTLFVGKIFSINDIVKEINQAFNENNADFYNIPQTRKKIAQDLFLFENSGSDDLTKIVDSQFKKTRVTIKTPWVDAIAFGNFIKNIEKQFQDKFQDSANINITGTIALLARTIPATINSAVVSYIFAFIMIAVMMVFVVRDLKLGLLSMIPNLLPIFLVLGIMGLCKIPMDMMSVLIGSIVLGIAVDDTVHFMYNFQKYYEQTGNAHKAIQHTLLTTGRAMLITSIVLCAGFLILMFASMTNVIRFGMLTSIAIIVALLADFVLAPSLMILVTRNKNN